MFTDPKRKGLSASDAPMARNAPATALNAMANAAAAAEAKTNNK